MRSDFDYDLGEDCDEDAEPLAGDKMCAECGRPLPVDALLDGSNLCSPECVDDYYPDWAAYD